MAQLGDHRGVYGFVGISPGNRPYLREEAMTGTTAHRLVKVKAGQVWHQRDQDVYVGFTGSCWHDTPVPGSSDTACPNTWHCCVSKLISPGLDRNKKPACDVIINGHVGGRSKSRDKELKTTQESFSTSTTDTIKFKSPPLNNTYEPYRTPAAFAPLLQRIHNYRRYR